MRNRSCPVEVQLRSVSYRSELQRSWPQGQSHELREWTRGDRSRAARARWIRDATSVLAEGETPTTDLLARSEKLARLEAALFAADGPLAARRLAKVANLLDGTEARTLVHQLNEQYEADGSAFRVEPVAGGYRLFTRPEFSQWLLRRLRPSVGPTLSGPALETLAIAAYRQPILRAQIEAIRGVQCDEMLRQLLDKGLVRIVGRESSLGRPILYGTTRKFLELFGLKSLADLPLADRLRQPANEVANVPPAGEGDSPAPNE